MALNPSWVSATAFSNSLMRAETERMVRRSGNLDLLDGQGLWSKSGNRFFNVRNLRAGHIPEQISLYEFGPDNELIRAIDARGAELGRAHGIALLFRTCQRGGGVTAREGYGRAARANHRIIQQALLAFPLDPRGRLEEERCVDRRGLGVVHGVDPQPAPALPCVRE